MQTETQTVPKINITSTGFLSLAMTALRLSVPRKRLISSKERTLSLEEISWHDNEKDCWVIIYDRVYDLTDFFDEHPGGAEVLLEYAGRDATIAFRGVGHSKAAIKALDKFLIGELPIHERLFRKPDGIILTEIPT